MKIGIHLSKNSFSERWKEYCEEKQIPWKQVDCYRNDIISQLGDCDALMWHINQNNPKEILFAKQLIISLQHIGKKVFPDINTSWHFDDKVGQKYLFDAIGVPQPRTWIFYDKKEAIDWSRQQSYPIVFKLRGGGGSQNVRLVKTKWESRRLIRKAFGSGFRAYYAYGSLLERWRKLKLGRSNFRDVIEGLIRFVIPPQYAIVNGRERGYVYFQEFLPGNNFDIRVIVIGEKAFAIKRMTRKDDFRSSGSGIIVYDKDNFEDATIALSFQLAVKMKTQCAAFDFVYFNNQIYVLEVSFGFVKEGYDLCPGYWDKKLIWHEGDFNPYGWIVEGLIE